MKVGGQWGVGFTVIAELKFDVPAMYDFHRKANVVIEVLHATPQVVHYATP